MNTETWKKWTPEDAREAIDSGNVRLLQSIAYAFATLLEAEQRGERCVLPREVVGQEIDTMKCFNGDWSVWISGSCEPEGKGNTQEAAIMDLARKLRGE